MADEEEKEEGEEAERENEVEVEEEEEEGVVAERAVPLFMLAHTALKLLPPLRVEVEPRLGEGEGVLWRDRFNMDMKSLTEFGIEAGVVVVVVAVDDGLGVVVVVAVDVFVVAVAFSSCSFVSPFAV